MRCPARPAPPRPREWRPADSRENASVCGRACACACACVHVRVFCVCALCVFRMCTSRSNTLCS